VLNFVALPIVRKTGPACRTRALWLHKHPWSNPLPVWGLRASASTLQTRVAVICSDVSPGVTWRAPKTAQMEKLFFAGRTKNSLFGWPWLPTGLISLPGLSPATCA